jgi:hypothetical protein
MSVVEFLRIDLRPELRQMDGWSGDGKKIPRGGTPTVARSLASLISRFMRRAGGCLIAGLRTHKTRLRPVRRHSVHVRCC